MITFVQQYLVMQFAYNLGDILGVSSIQTMSIEYPTGPTVIQIINCVLFSFLSLQWNILTSYWLIFIWLIFIGAQGGTCYTNFIFLANSKTNLKQDLGLSFFERELAVNLLLISLSIGVFFAAVVCFFVMQYWFPEMLYNPPG